MSFRKILVPVDFSVHSERALQTAVSLARDSEAALTIVHVFEPLAIAVPEGYQLFTEQQLERMFAEIERELAEQKRRAEASGLQRVATQLLHGFAASEVVQFAREGGFDLIVMGTHGRRGVSHLLLGSVAERVGRLGPCPVHDPGPRGPRRPGAAELTGARAPPAYGVASRGVAAP